MPRETLDKVQQCQAAAHLLTMLSQAQQQGWHEMAAKAATSLLRFVSAIANGAHTASVVPIDKALFLAGTAWQQVCSLLLLEADWLQSYKQVPDAYATKSVASLVTCTDCRPVFRFVAIKRHTWATSASASAPRCAAIAKVQRYVFCRCQKLRGMRLRC